MYIILCPRIGGYYKPLDMGNIIRNIIKILLYGLYNKFLIIYYVYKTEYKFSNQYYSFTISKIIFNKKLLLIHLTTSILSTLFSN